MCFFMAIFQNQISCFMVGLLSTHFILSHLMKLAGLQELVASHKAQRAAGWCRVKLLRCSCHVRIEHDSMLQLHGSSTSGSCIWHVASSAGGKSLTQNSLDIGGFAIQAAGKQLVQLCVG